MMRRYTQSKWVIATIMLLTIVGITLVTVPGSHATNAKAASSLTGNQHQNCNQQTPQSEWGYTFYPCAPIGLGSMCLKIHTDPKVTARVVVCAYAGEAALGYFDVICKTHELRNEM